uniref:Secreted protein n=1 Tax=Oryza meridionalis TaxID=40149 RepID=A0A0E0EK80_9ORYZ
MPSSSSSPLFLSLFLSLLGILWESGLALSHSLLFRLPGVGLIFCPWPPHRRIRPSAAEGREPLSISRADEGGASRARPSGGSEDGRLRDQPSLFERFLSATSSLLRADVMERVISGLILQHAPTLCFTLCFPWTSSRHQNL